MTMSAVCKNWTADEIRAMGLKPTLLAGLDMIAGAAVTLLTDGKDRQALLFIFPNGKDKCLVPLKNAVEIPFPPTTDVEG